MQRTNEFDFDMWKGLTLNFSQLRSFKIDGRYPLALFELNLMLKELKICTYEFTDIEALSSYQGLEHLDIHWGIENLPRNWTISLPNLRTLRIGGLLHEVFHHLRAPPLDLSLIHI